MNLPVKALIPLQKDLPLRRAMRLFCWFGLTQKSCFRIDNELIASSSAYFSTHCFQTYLKYLRRHHLIGKDRHGNFYLRGIKFFRQWLSLQNPKISMMNLCLEDVATCDSFEVAVCARAVTKTEIHVKRNTRKRERACLVVHSNPAKPDSTMSGASKVGTPLSLVWIMKLYGVSKTKASKMRKNAARSEFVTSTPQFIGFTTPDNAQLKMGWSQFLQFRGWYAEENGAGEAHKLVLRRNKVFIQLPNLVSSTIKFRNVTRPCC